VARSRTATASTRHRSPDLDDAPAFRIHRTNRLLRTHLARFLGDVAPDVTPEQWFVLARLAHRGPVRQIDLAEPVLGDPPNVSRLVDTLVARGHAERRPDPADRRSWLVTLTPDGQRLTGAILARATDEREAVFAGFAAHELDALSTMLDRIDDNVRRLLSP
jgi:DNA-binding MarR family transcriptional regulator